MKSNAFNAPVILGLEKNGRSKWTGGGYKTGVGRAERGILICMFSVYSQKR